MQVIHSIAVVGAGTMGSGIAQVFAQAGFDVQLQDTSPHALERSARTVQDSLDRFVFRGALAPGDREAILGRIVRGTSIEACAAADLVIEAIVEEPSAKCALFETLDVLCGADVFFASNTSSVSLTRLGGATSRPARVFGMHFMNPVPVMPLVELVRGRDTSNETMQVGRGLCEALGKTVIESADAPGFLANRILMPMINEAIHALMEGVGSAEAIDGVMTIGMKHPMGPLALADLIGLDVCQAILDVMEEAFGDPKYRACPLLRQMVTSGQLGRKSGQGFYRYDSPQSA